MSECAFKLARHFDVLVRVVKVVVVELVEELREQPQVLFSLEQWKHGYFLVQVSHTLLELVLSQTQQLLDVKFFRDPLRKFAVVAANLVSDEGLLKTRTVVCKHSQ